MKAAPASCKGTTQVINADDPTIGLVNNPVKNETIPTETRKS